MNLKDRNITDRAIQPLEDAMTGAIETGWVLSPRALGALPSFGAGEGPEAALLVDTVSPVAEQYRAIKAKLEHLARQRGKPVRSLVITSPGSGDGKTLTALNLALVLAQDENRSVLMIDADLRKHGIAPFFVEHAKAGLVEALAGKAPLAATMFRPEGSRLAILPAGGMIENPADLLGSVRMQRLMAHLSETFDHIILDTPPVGLFIEADLLAAFTDGCLVVVRAESTPRRLAARCVETMRKHNLIGLVMNDVRSTPFERYYKYDSYYHRKKEGR
jgi:protein-tyrosine kinase